MHPDAAETATLRNWMEIMTDLPWSRVIQRQSGSAQGPENSRRRSLRPGKSEGTHHRGAGGPQTQRETQRARSFVWWGRRASGKTSLGRSIARALGRKFMRLSLGGVHDEAEIRGHRRTYVGAMPGRIIQSIQQAGTNNPLIMLDEIDKVGADFRGDPSSALLEVLDPEQNYSFRDNYLGVAFDLSNVIFMTTANILDTVQSALRDRMEVIRLAGYTEEEKLEIARRHLLPKQMEENGITAKNLNISRSALLAMIQRYTQEAGLRQLEREIGSICRKVARRIGEGQTGDVCVSQQTICTNSSAHQNYPGRSLEKDQIGVATGLAWTAVGGDVLFVEALRMKGKGNLVLTGQLGDVMRESAQAAYSYAKSRAKELQIDPDDFHNYDMHIHIPEGAIPKDGPSAGITLATALVSALSPETGAKRRGNDRRDHPSRQCPASRRCQGERSSRLGARG